MTPYPTATQLARQREQEIIDGHHDSGMPRYSMIGTPGGYQEFESDNGEWVRFKDVEKLVTVCQEFISEIQKRKNQNAGTDGRIRREYDTHKTRTND